MKRGILLALIVSFTAFLCINSYASIFSSFKKVNRSYNCQGLSLKMSRKSEHSLQREYRFAGICSVKDQRKQYREIWVDIVGEWNQRTHTAKEWAEISGVGSGEIEIVLQCISDPWISPSYCSLKSLHNTTAYPGFSEVFTITKVFPILCATIQRSAWVKPN